MSTAEYTVAVLIKGVVQVELQFQKKSSSCLRSVLAEVQNMEQTQEIRIPEGMPGIDRVVSAWGQVVMRSKEWHSSRITLSAGMLVWVLYIPEEGGNPQCVNGWIPFQIHWDLPELCDDGNVRILCIPRFVDARSVSAGKIMVRAGVAAMAEAWCREEKTVYLPSEVPEDIQLLRSTYPVRLPKEAGERQFLLDEELTLPGSAPMPERVLYYRMNPAVSDKKVLSNKAVFRGSGNLHILYESPEGQLHSWDFELPWSQFAELEDSYSQDAQLDVRLMPTSVEVETIGEGKLHLKCAMTAQYLVDDQELLELTEDAYSPGRELNILRETMDMPAILDSRQENIYGEQTLPADVDLVADVQFLPDFPKQQRSGDTLSLYMPGFVQLLCYRADGELYSLSGRWEGKLELPADDSSSLAAMPLPGSEVQVLPERSSVNLKATVPVQLQFTSGQGMEMIAGMELGDPVTPDPERPSLVLMRMENRRLWDLAKACGTTMEAIRQANGLSGEPAPGQMLLIPVK